MFTIPGRRSVASWVTVAMLAGGLTLAATPAQAAGLSILGSDSSRHTADELTLSYDANNGTGSAAPQSAVANATVTLNDGAGLGREGYTIDGWTTGQDGSGTGYALGATFRMPAHGMSLFAHWRVNQYSVAYDANAGSGTEAAVTADFGAQVSLGRGGGLAREGYTLDGWNTAKDGSGTPYALGDSFTLPSHSVALFAHWRANAYGVHYDANAGDGVETDQLGDFGSTVTLSRGAALSRDGYTLDGWTTDPDGSGTHYGLGATMQVPSRGVSLYAHWKANSYDVQYDANAGDGSESAQTADFATDVTLGTGAGLSRIGWTLDGWDTAADGTGTRYGLGAALRMPSHAMRLFAHWNLNKYDVSYEHNDGTGESTTDSQGYGQEFQVGHGYAFGRLCYTLDSWNTAADGSGHRYGVDDPIRMPSGGLRLFAHWVENTYDVTYDANAEHGAASPQSKQFNSSVTLSDGTGLTRDGYTLDGWTTGADGSGTFYALGTAVRMPCNGMHLFGRWSINKYKVWYESNDGTGSTTDATEDFGAEFPAGHAYGLYRPCFTLDSWNTSSDGTGRRYGIGELVRMPAGGMRLFARWAANTYDVTYDANADQGTAADQSAAYDSALALGDGGGLTREGYTFAGWATEPDGSGASYAPGEGIHMPCRGLHLFGQWKINSYALRYDANGGTGSEPSLTRTYASLLPLADGTGMSRTGYTLVGWNTAADGSGYAFPLSGAIKVPCHNVVLYAQWVANDYSVTYRGNGATGGSVPDAQTFTVEAPASIAGNTGTLTRDGYTFAGWATSADGSVAYTDGSVYGEASNLELYAVWLAAPYAVVYNANGATGGTVPDAQTFTVESPALIAGNPGSLVRTRYLFLGWSSTPTGPVDYATGTSYATPTTLTLYAVWTAAPVTIPPMRTSTKHATPRVMKPLATVAPPAGQTWVIGSLRLIKPSSHALVTKVVAKQGVWTLDLRKATVTFAPTKTFVGTAAVGFRVTSSGGLVATSTLTVVVLPARTMVRSATVYFAPMSAVLTPQAKATLKALAASVKKLGRPLSSVTTGYVQATSTSANDRSLSLARARTIAAYLTALGLPHASSALGLGKAADKGWKARRATATVTFLIS